MTILDDTITPTAKAIRDALLANPLIAATVVDRIRLAAARDTDAYPHVVLKAATAYEQDATHADLSWQPQQWDLWAVADTADEANALAGLVAGTLNGTTLTIADTTSLLVRRMGTLPATRVRLSDTVNKYMAAATMLVGVRTGGQA